MVRHRKYKKYKKYKKNNLKINENIKNIPSFSLFLLTPDQVIF